MSLPLHFISCDWGTSNFRLRLVETKTLKVLSEHRTDVGIKNHFQKFKNQQTEDQHTFFAIYLMEQMNHLDLDKTNDLFVVASGMLSSSIGMKELPYANMPIAFNGEDLICEAVSMDGESKLLLVSGAKTENDVMRGEEIQAVGLSNRLPKEERGILLLPGTHSKHITFQKGRFEDFTTYMTGELFEIISKQSILAASLKPAEWDTSFREIFLRGVGEGVANRQMTSLFSIRANDLIKDIPRKQNYFFLSGLLIGGELAALKDRNETVYLAATGINNELYKLALERFLPFEQIVCFEEGVLEKAVLTGQRKILETYA